MNGDGDFAPMQQAIEVATRFLDGTGKALEASVNMLPAGLGAQEQMLANDALREAGAILCDAARRLRKPLPPLDSED